MSVRCSNKKSRKSVRCSDRKSRKVDRRLSQFKRQKLNQHRTKEAKKIQEEKEEIGPFVKFLTSCGGSLSNFPGSTKQRSLMLFFFSLILLNL